jgi:putative transposase
MGNRITKELALDALLITVLCRKPDGKLLVHSDQGNQYTSHDWSEFFSAHGLEGSMSRRDNCYGNAVAESFFKLLKRERIKRNIYATRAMQRWMCLIILRCFRTRNVSIVPIMGYHR